MRRPGPGHPSYWRVNYPHLQCCRWFHYLGHLCNPKTTREGSLWLSGMVPQPRVEATSTVQRPVRLPTPTSPTRTFPRIHFRYGRRPRSSRKSTARPSRERSRTTICLGRTTGPTNTMDRVFNLFGLVHYRPRRCAPNLSRQHAVFAELRSRDPIWRTLWNTQRSQFASASENAGRWTNQRSVSGKNILPMEEASRPKRQRPRPRCQWAPYRHLRHYDRSRYSSNLVEALEGVYSVGRVLQSLGRRPL